MVEDSPAQQRTEFGRPMLERHFPHVARSGILMLNNGSFGIAPKCVLDSKQRLTDEYETFADEFARLRQVGLNWKSLTCIASRLGVKPAQCALLENVTFGVSNILNRLLALEPEGSEVLVNAWTYGSTKIAATEVGPAGQTAPEVALRQPIESAEDVLRSVAEELDRRPKVRVAIFDHITSTTACLMPVKELTTLCHSRGVKVIIDGAHAIGQVLDLNIEDIGADFYLGNLNKWHFLPKSVALMWISEAHLSVMNPDIISWLMHDEVLPHRYAYLGTRDTSSFYVIPEAAKFIDEVCGGLTRVHEYCRGLADEASEHLARVWSSGLLPLPPSMQAPFMRLIRLPQHLQRPAIKEMVKEVRLSSDMWKFLAYKLKMNLMIVNVQDALYARISASITVDMQDVRLLGEVMMRLSEADLSLSERAVS